MQLVGRFAAIVAFVLAVALSAGADESDKAKAKAKALYEAGQADYNLGHFDKALKFYEDAYKIRAVPALLFNIAQCHRQLGDMRSAATTYKAFLRTAKPEDPSREKAVALLVEVEGALEKQAHARDAKPLDTVAEESKPASDGPPDIEPSVPETPVATAEAAVAKAPSGGQVALTVPRAAASAPAAAVSSGVEAPAPQAKKGRTLTWIAAGASAVALAGGGYFGMKSKSTASSLESSRHKTEEIDRLRPTVAADASKANLMFAAGAVLAVAAGTFFVLEF